MTMDLDHEDRKILVDILETSLADLRMEIGRTSSQSSRDQLRKRRKVLEKTIKGLREEAAQGGLLAGKEVSSART